MIFYFTGTGNSYAAALGIQQEVGGELINITDCLQKGRYEFAPEKDEAAGFVFPVYFGGLPSIVNDFLERVHFASSPEYLYGVLTYGGRFFGAGGMLEKKIKDSGLELSAVFGLKMPANYAIMYEPPREEEADEILEGSAKRLEEILEQILDRALVKEGTSKSEVETSIKFYPRYNKDRQTAPFYVDDQCVSCGICAERCPVKAIELIDGTPTWIKETCVFCMSCLRCNAIQYGDVLKGRYRYRHPIFRKKTKGKTECH
ncbi:MAG: EFR1 family ferrodoxin [Lachnospiraceae bacterium]|nr:EFR1 family ferrodoxin [Lachnospiraceae bacterium]